MQRHPVLRNNWPSAATYYLAYEPITSRTDNTSLRAVNTIQADDESTVLPSKHFEFINVVKFISE